MNRQPYTASRFSPRMAAPLLAAAALACVPWLHAAEPPLPEKPAGNPENLAADAASLMDNLTELVPSEPNDPLPDRIPPSLEKAREELDRIRSKEQRWQKLLRQGVLAPAEVEKVIIESASALARYHHALVANTERDLAAIKLRVAAGTADVSLQEASAAALAAAQESALKAETQLRKTRYDIAKINYSRYQRLFAEKMAPRHLFERASSELKKREAEMAAPVETAATPVVSAETHP